MQNKSFLSAVIFVIIFGAALAISYAMHGVATSAESIVISGTGFIISAFVSSSVNIANPWDKAVVLRLGKFQAPRGPGLFFIVPVLDTIPYWIDTRVITTSFKAEKTFTKDTVPVEIVPSSAVETKGLGSMVGLTALTMGLGQDKIDKGNETVKETEQTS